MQLEVSGAREEILRSAISLFARKGYAGTGVQEILDAVDLSKPTLYYHFESKAGLFRAIMDYAYDRSFELMQRAVDAAAGTIEKLVGAASALFEFAETNRELTRLVLTTAFAAPEEVPPETLDLNKRKRNFELMVGVLRRGQKEGAVDRRYDVDDLAHGIFGAISHRIRSHLLAGNGTLNRRQAERIVDLFMNGAKAGK